MSTSKLESSTVVLDVNFHTPNSVRPGSLNEVEVDSDKDSLKLSKEYIRSPHYNKTAALRNGFRAWLKRRALPSPFKNGTYLIPIKILPDVYEALEKYKAEYNEAADALKDDWVEIVEDAKKRLRKQFDPNNYPSASSFRRGFGLDWQLRQFVVPDQSTLGEVLYKEELKKAKEAWKDAEYEVTMALRQGMAELLEHLVKQLEESSTDGSKKRVSKAAVEHLNEFFDMFSKRDVLGDSELKKLVTKAKSVLSGKTPDDLRKDLKGKVTSELKKVAGSLDKLITSSKRVITFDED